MVVMPGSDHLEDWYAETGLGDNYVIAVSDTGYINDSVSLEWIHHFDTETQKVQLGEYRLLLLDGHISHCTVEFVRYCDDNKIIPLCLPPHTTHFLQPLDVMVFQPYKHYHSKAIEEATRLGNPEFDKIEFLANLTAIREQALKEKTIRASFRATGLQPFDIDLVLNKLREVTQSDPDHSQPIGLGTTSSHRQQTPEPSESIPLVIKTPTTIRSLKRLHEEILVDLQPNSVDPFNASPKRKRIEKYLKGIIPSSSYLLQGLTF